MKLPMSGLHHRLPFLTTQSILTAVFFAGSLLHDVTLRASDDSKPVAYWSFGQEESTQLQAVGGVHRDVPGPRPQTYPNFSADNTAVRLDGNGSRFVFKDPGNLSPYDYTNGDEITLEAWVKIDSINTGDNVYIIGKGRTGNAGFSPDNQNWALRVCEREGRIRISFLFSTVTPPNSTPKNQSNWHRWISDEGFKHGPQWHHVAISYRFGTPESLVGVIDGKQVTGRWDAGGPTRNTPTVDNDDIWIGSAMGGAPATSFRGDLDEIAIYRKALSAAELKSRYRGPESSLSVVAAPEEMPKLGNLPEGQVQVSYHEGMPDHTRWLYEGEHVPTESIRWQTGQFLLDRLPQKFDAWGIRDDWRGPVLVRMAADVSLSPGEHQFMMRVRGLSRLWVNGVLVARGRPLQRGQDGFEPITPVTPAPKPGVRIAEHRQQEVFGKATIGSDGKCRVVLETYVGGKDLRADPGEICVAIESADKTTFELLNPRGAHLPLTDRIITGLLDAHYDDLKKFDDERRRDAARSQDEFWQKRHQIARDWAAKHPASLPSNTTSNASPIDAFVDAKIQSALQASSKSPLSEARHFHETVLPILRDQCFRCHGEKTQGGLSLNSLEGIKKGGDSGLTVIHVGDAAKSELISRVRATSLEERMPPGGEGLKPQQIAILEDWITSGAKWPAPPVTQATVAFTPVASDEIFVRRAYLDTVGVIPTGAETQEFLNDRSADKRTHLVDKLLQDERWADHWTSYWQDVLAENPTLLNSSLNTTGPFRWYLYDSMRDNKAMDRFVTELILLRGSIHEGGSAGFGVASNNDAPFAAKGQIVAGAFLGMELQCARCHDAPYHSSTQKDLYSLAAMFSRKPVSVPNSSQVPAAFFEKQDRSPLIKVTLKPGEAIPPEWPFAEETGCADDQSLTKLVRDAKDTREKLAALITSPHNQRFAKVIVNRVWRRLIGVGIVSSADDWEGKSPSHPELLEWLAKDFVAHNYDLKHLVRQIMTSQIYQRTSVRTTVPVPAEMQFFVTPARRRMTAEQIVDSLVVAVGKRIDVEEMTFAPEAGRPSSNRLSLGVPTRAWQFTSLANERDRPSLSLPRARAIADILEAFGWNGARQNPRTDRESDPNILQPGILQNSDAVVLLTRATQESGLAEEALNAESPDDLLETLFLRILSRLPNDDERVNLTPFLANGFADRLLPQNEWKQIKSPDPLPLVTWSNHVRPESNTIAVEMEQRAKAGVPPDPRFRPEWRESYEDIVWSLINLSEFVWVP